MKTYKVWFRICIEEYDDESNTYRNVSKNDETGEMEEYDSDSLDEICMFESDSYDEAQKFSNDFKPWS